MAFDYETKDVGGRGSISGQSFMIDNPDTVSSISTTMKDWEDKTILPRTLLGGTRAMRGAGIEFLPRHTLESDRAYSARLARSTLLNVYRKTSSFLAGQVFQSAIVFDEAVDDIFQTWSQEIDSSGNDVDIFGKRNFQNGLSKGVSHIFIDVPKRADSVKTRADEQAAGIRPYLKEIRAEDMLGAIVSNDGFLEQVRFMESAIVREGKYGVKIIQRVRVLEPGLWELHEIAADGATSIVDSGTFSIDVIPFVPFIPGEEWSIITGEPPYVDLAELNAKHWRSASDQDNILHVARVPILFGKNIELANMPVGTATMITSDDPDADIKYVEVTGQAINAGREDLKETEAQMALYGLQQLIPRKGNMTATEKALTSSESNSSLGTWATEYETVLNMAFRIMGMFMGVEFPADGLAINKEYNFGIANPEELAQILKSHDQGIISAQATFSEFRRRGIFEEHLSWDDMEADLEQERRNSIDMAGIAGSAFGGDGEGGDE